MPVLNPNEIAPEDSEARQEGIASSIISNAPEIPGIRAVRHITPLVMVALQRSNNPYVTAKRGFDAMGVDFDKDGASLDPASFGIAMMPKTAEVLILLSCDRDKLKRYALDSATLVSDALDFMDEVTPEVLAEATVFISEELMGISKARTVKVADEHEAPEATPLKGGGTPGPKKHNPTG